MRILLNDFGGYPFPFELSRYLAHGGYTIEHCFLSNINTPHGSTEKTDADSANLLIQPIQLKDDFKKYSPRGRYKGEIEYAKRVAEEIDKFKPDIFLSANTPLFAQNKLLKKCKEGNIKFIYWCQDIHGIAIERFFYKKLSVFGAIFSWYFKAKEINLLRESNHVITIAESFNQIFAEWGLKNIPMSVIHNWGPYSEIELLDKKNEWSVRNEIDSKTVVLYSGTLGLKHNPMLIANAASFFKSNTNVVFVIVSEGLGADILKQQKALLGLDNLLLLPFQDYKALSKMLSSADILLSILEKEAGLFSVPSKVLTYLCAGKAILLSVPQDNLSAKIIVGNQAGVCVEPDNTEDFIAQLTKLINDPSQRKIFGENGRKYASDNFRISLIAEKFVAVFNQLK